MRIMTRTKLVSMATAFTAALIGLSVAPSASAGTTIGSSRISPAVNSASICPAGSDPSLWDPKLNWDPRTPVTVWNRTIELRLNSGTHCAWGRISNGNPGDSVWVDWSNTAGNSWDQLSVTKINSGYTQVYTAAHNDSGYWMRACGKAGDRPEVVCTGWY